MRVRHRAVHVAGVIVAVAAAVATTSLPAGAVASAGQVVHVVKDQAGGAYYNVTTGERFDVTAASAAPTLAGFGVQATNGLVLTDSGQLLVPINSVTAGTPAASVVQVAEVTTLGTYQSASDGALFAIQTAGTALPTTNEWALRLATGTILTINNEVLLPVEHVAGLN